MPRVCPFDQRLMTPVPGRAEAMLLLSLLVSPTSAILRMLESSANVKLNGQVQKCDDCGFIAIFEKGSRPRFGEENVMVQQRNLIDNRVPANGTPSKALCYSSEGLLVY